MGSTKEIEFTVFIAPDGTTTYEHDAADQGQVERIIQAVQKSNAPSHVRRVLPLADEILTPEETAAHLGIPKKTIIFLCAEGRLEGAFKAGRRWRIPGSAVRKMAGVP